MKTAELIVMPFGLWTQVGPRNHVLCIFRIPLENGHFLGGGTPAMWPFIRILHPLVVNDTLDVC